MKKETEDVAIALQNLHNGLDNFREKRILELQEQALKEGACHYVNEDFKKAYKALKEGDSWGSGQCQFYMGLLLTQGQGCKKNHKKAMIMFRKAKRNGHEKAAELLGKIEGDMKKERGGG